MRLGAMLTDILKSMFKKTATERYPFVKKEAPRNLRGKIVWDREACTACGLCAKDCPSNAIKVVAYDKKEKDIVFEYQVDTCLYCAQCVHTCNKGALRMSNDDWEIAALNRDGYTLVWGKDESVDKYLAGELPEEPAKKKRLLPSQRPTQAPGQPQPLLNNASAASESQVSHVDGKSSRPRVVILGVGNIDNGDDAVGVLASRHLIDALAGLDDVLVIEAGLAPEGQTGPIRRFGAELVLIIDAAQMDESPGTIRWLDWRETDGMSASTHTMPLFMLGKFLSMDMGCEVALLGIQPVHNVPGVPVSPEALAAVDAVVDGIVHALGV